LTIAFERRVVVPAHVVVQEVEGESVLLNLDSERYFGLDEVGTRMWEVLTATASVQAAYDALLAEYDVAPDVLQQDMTELIEQLVEHGLVELNDG
jgi:hypothetical protein